MIQIGRNDKCPCGSGKKYKRCCAGKLQVSKDPVIPQESHRVTLGGAIGVIQAMAKEKKETLQELGVFLLYADSQGDAWVLEVTDSDCIQISSAGEALDVPIEENEKTIMVDWSHRFCFKNKQLQIDAYRSKEQKILLNAPSQQLSAAARRILKRYSPELLDQVHINEK